MFDLETIVAIPAIANSPASAVAAGHGGGRWQEQNGKSSYAKPGFHWARLRYGARLAIAARRTGFPDAAGHHDRAVSAPGGPTDTFGRIMAASMGETLGEPVIVENVGGANGTIGVARAARALPDGYTLGVGQWSTNVVNGAVYDLPYDLLKDFAPVARLVSGPQLLVANKNLPANNLVEFIAWLKANPGKALAATAGVGSQQHISGVYFQNATKTQFKFIPYRGAAPAMQDLMSGQVDFMFDQVGSSLPQVRNGTIKVFAVTADKRLVSAPDIPTFAEAG